MVEWMGKQKVVNHHNDVPFHVLERKYDYGRDGLRAVRDGFGRDGYGRDGRVPPEGFGFYELGPQLMIDGVLNEDVPTEKIREYVWYTETKGKVCAQCGGETPPPHEGASPRGGAVSAAQEDPYLLGVAFGVAYYFCYEKNKSMTLNRAMLKKIKTKAESISWYSAIRRVPCPMRWSSMCS